MKTYILSVIVIFISDLSIVLADSTKIKEFEGFWAREKYVDSLTRTHSQFAENPESVETSMSEGRLFWTNYHEGSWRHIFDIEVSGETHFFVVGNWEVESPDLTDKLPVSFRERRDAAGKITTIEFLDSSLVSYKEEAFVKLDLPLDQYANNVLLVGTYTDDKGMTFTFSKDGMASWPEKSFYYDLPLDSSEAGCDYFQTDDRNEPGQRKRYGFQWKGKELQLFKIVYDRDIPIQCEDKPFVSLIRR